MTCCAQPDPFACPVGVECRNCGLTSLVPQPNAVKAVERQDGPRPGGGSRYAAPLCGFTFHDGRGCDRPLGHEGECIPRPASHRSGNGHAPAPFPAVNPQAQPAGPAPAIELCGAKCPDHDESCNTVAGHEGNHCSPNFYWLPGADYASDRRNARPVPGPAQHIKEALCERERAAARSTADAIVATITHDATSTFGREYTDEQYEQLVQRYADQQCAERDIDLAKLRATLAEIAKLASAAGVK